MKRGSKVAIPPGAGGKQGVKLGPKPSYTTQKLAKGGKRGKD